MSDPLPEIKARRAAMPPEPPVLVEEAEEEEYYAAWWRLDHPTKGAVISGQRFPDLVALVGHDDRDVAEFIAHAPVDIDTLIGEVERLREVEERLHGTQVTIGKLSHEIERLRGLLGRLEWAGICREDDACPACHSWKRVHYPDCWLAAAIRPTSPDPPEGEQP